MYTCLFRLQNMPNLAIDQSMSIKEDVVISIEDKLWDKIESVTTLLLMGDDIVSYVSINLVCEELIGYFTEDADIDVSDIASAWLEISHCAGETVAEYHLSLWDSDEELTYSVHRVLDSLGQV